MIDIEKNLEMIRQQLNEAVAQDIDNLTKDEIVNMSQMLDKYILNTQKRLKEKVCEYHKKTATF